MTSTPTVAVVTGASRGAGAGIARALGSHGCTVYVTARTRDSGASRPADTVDETAARVSAAGGTGIAVAIDHGDDAQVEALFDQIAREHGKVDILVNNAAIIRDEMMGRTKFWEEPINVIDTLNVGLRSSYVATVYAAPFARRALGRRAGGALRIRPGLWRAEGRDRQDGCRHGRGLPRVRNRRGISMDGLVADRTGQKDHRQQLRKVRPHP